ncbi:MAG: alpha/beta fold hydrolase [Gemmatimonadota bacterium]|nr:alpha/beta fold hydrolase [Gemmatimonadota bacterium]
MTPSTIATPPPTPSRRWLARLLLTAGGIALLLTLLLPVPPLELARLIVGGVVTPATRFVGYAGLFAAALLTISPLVGRWPGGPRRAIAFGLGGIGALAVLLAWWRVAVGPTVETVHYRSADIDVEGSLYLPAGPGPFAAAVIVHGSAPFRRGLYDQWADSLARRGIAVLVPDKRGVGGSGGESKVRDNAAQSYLELLARDIVSGVQFLASRAEIDGRRIGLVGISQGGWVGPLAAAQDSSIAWLVLLSGPATSTGEEGVWSHLRGDHDNAAVLSLKESNDSLTRTAPEGFDPRATLAALGMPSLWLFGEEDNSVPTAKSVAVLDSLAAQGRPVEWRVFPGADHVMVRHDGPLGLLHTDPLSWPVWLDWVVQRGAPASAARD